MNIFSRIKHAAIGLLGINTPAAAEAAAVPGNFNAELCHAIRRELKQPWTE